MYTAIYVLQLLYGLLYKASSYSLDMTGCVHFLTNVQFSIKLSRGDQNRNFVSQYIEKIYYDIALYHSILIFLTRHTWFLKIVSVRMSVCMFMCVFVCVYVCVHP